MAQSQTQRYLHTVLGAIERLEKLDPGNAVSFTLIEQELGLDTQDVRGYLEILKDEGKVIPGNPLNNRSVFLTSKGRLAFKDPEYFWPEAKTGDRLIIGRDVSTGGGNFAGRDYNEVHNHFSDPSFSLSNESAQLIEQILQAAQTNIVEDALRRNLKIRERLRKEFPRRSDYQYKIGDSPHLKYVFETVIVHSITDMSYGRDGDFPPNEYGYSGWFRLDMWDLYHDGLELWVDIEEALIDETERWMLLERGQNYDTDHYTKIKLYRIGRIPLRNIVEFDVEADEYYGQPHLYCRFDGNDGPFSEYRWVMVDDNRIKLSLPYYPMDSTKRVKAFSNYQEDKSNAA